jgi:hypothetical protein
MTRGDKELWIVFGGAGVLLLAYLFWPKGASVVNPPAPAPTVAG